MHRLPRQALAAVLALAIVLAVGCGGDDEDDPTSTTRTPTSGALVEYSRGGGIAGVDETLRIEADGSGTVELGEPESRSLPVELSAAELERLETLLSAADLGAIAPADTGCADCFVYTVRHDGDEATLDDVTLPEAPLPVQELIGYLGEIAVKPDPVS